MRKSASSASRISIVVRALKQSAQPRKKSFGAHHEIFISLSRALLDPFFKRSAAALKKKIAGVFDARAFQPKVPDDFFVVEKHVAVVMPDAIIAFRLRRAFPNNRLR
jgi:hypothetical protein